MSRARAKIVNERPRATCCQIESCQSDGQVETPRPGATGIQIEHPSNRFYLGPMRVAGNDDVHSARYGVQPQFLHIVQHIDGASTESHHFGFGVFFGPLAGVDVPPDRSNRSNPQ